MHFGDDTKTYRTGAECLCGNLVLTAGKRDEGEGSGGGSGGHAGVRLLSALLTEMDGMELATGDIPSSELPELAFMFPAQKI